MLKLLTKLLLLTIAVAITHILMIFGLPHDRNHYYEAIPAKHDRLASLSSTKIVFVGGSNLMFGIDGDRIEEEFGYPVANMGIQMTFGLQYLLDEVRDDINEDDIVVLSLEYPLYHQSVRGWLSLRQVLTINPSLTLHNLHSLTQIETIFRHHSEFTRQRLYTLITDGSRTLNCDETLYCADNFTSNGQLSDEVIARSQPEPLPNAPIVDSSWHLSSRSIQLLQDFVEDMHQHGATVVIIFPPVPDFAYELSNGILDDLPADLQSQLSIPILGTPTDNIYPRELFHDTEYHLNVEGRQIHTTHVINQLHTVFPNK